MGKTQKFGAQPKMAKDRIGIDYGNVPITKLPPGKALGADDLTTWALRRAGGRSGDAPRYRERSAVMHCDRCNETFNILVSVRPRKKPDIQRCRKCDRGMRFIGFSGSRKTRGASQP